MESKQAGFQQCVPMNTNLTFALRDHVMAGESPAAAHGIADRPLLSALCIDISSPYHVVLTIPIRVATRSILLSLQAGPYPSPIGERFAYPLSVTPGGSLRAKVKCKDMWNI